MPSEHNSRLWVERTPEGFVFDVKAFRLFTSHQTPPAALPADIRKALGTSDNRNIYYRNVPEDAREELWRRFRLSLDPLRRAGKLGVVVFQFPPWFVFRRTNLAHILECAERLQGLPIAVEFRNKIWLGERHRDEVLAFERENGLAHVVVDEPQGFASSIPAIWDATNPEVAVVRLHGRNRETWAKKGLTAAERFNYLGGEREDQSASHRRDLHGEILYPWTLGFKSVRRNVDYVRWCVSHHCGDLDRDISAAVIAYSRHVALMGSMIVAIGYHNRKLRRHYDNPVIELFFRF